MNFSTLFIALLVFFIQINFCICPGGGDDGKKTSNPAAKARLLKAVHQVVDDVKKDADRRANLLKGMTADEKAEYMRNHLIRQMAAGNRKKNYVSKVLHQKGSKEYFLPKDIEGVISVENGKWVVKKKTRDETVTTLLEFVETRLHTAWNNRVNELKVLKNTKKITPSDNKILEALQKDLEMTKLPLPKDGCKLYMNLDEDAKLKAFLWELSQQLDEGEVDEERERINDLELLYKVGQEKYQKKLEKKNAYEARKQKIRDEKKKKDDERKAKTAAKMKELNRKRAEKLAKKHNVPIEEFLDPEPEKKEDGDEDDGDDDDEAIELSTYTLINVIQYGNKAILKNAVIDFSKLPMKKEENDVAWYKRAIRFIRLKFYNIYLKIKKHLSKTPAEKAKDEADEKEGKLHDPVATRLRQESDADVKKLASFFEDTVKSEAPDMREEDSAEVKEEESKVKKIVDAGEYEHFAHYELTSQTHKPIDFLKDVKYNIYAKPVDKTFKKLKPKDFYEIARFLKGDTKSYANLDPKAWDGFAKTVEANPDNAQNCYYVAQLFQKAIYYKPNPTKPDLLHDEMLARLGAQALNSIINAKKVTGNMWFGLGLSLTVAGGVAVGLNVFAWPAVIATVCGASLGVVCPAAIPLAIFLYSMTGFICETIDSFFVGKVMDAIKSGEFSLLKGFWGTLKDASIAGGTSAGGAMLNNVVFVYNMFVVNMTAGIFTNIIATATAGAMVPMEINKMHKQTSMALCMRIKQGFFRQPTDAELSSYVIDVRTSRGSFFQRHKLWGKPDKSVLVTDMTADEKELAMYAYCKQEIQFSMEVSRTSGLLINSLGLGSYISMVTYIVMAVLDHYGVIRVVVSQAINILVNQPTEIISMIFGTVAGTTFGSRFLRGWMTTDAIKNEQIVHEIFGATVKQINSNSPDAVEITSEKMHYIYDTIAHKISMVWGKTINATMNKMTDGLMASFGSLFGVLFPDALKLKIITTISKGMEKFKNFRGKVQLWWLGVKDKFGVHQPGFKDNLEATKEEIEKKVIPTLPKKKFTEAEVKKISDTVGAQKFVYDPEKEKEEEEAEWEALREEISDEKGKDEV